MSDYTLLVGDALTRCEKETLVLLASGLRRCQIAKIRGIKENTARTVIEHVYEKLGVSSATQAALYAWRNGIVSIDDAWQRLMETQP